MKTLTQKIVATLALAAILTIPSLAQYTSHIKMVELKPFTQLDLNVDAQVILKKSSRNHLTLAGDSAFIASFPLTQNDSVLAFNYEKEPGDKLYRIVVEYTNLDSITTGGTGEYYFHKVEAESLEIYNPQANVRVNGFAGNIRILSPNGVNDVTELNANKMILQIGEAATLIDKTYGVISSLN